MSNLQTALPPEIRAEETSDGVRFILPRRDLGQARWAGLLVIAFGLGCTAFMVFWMLGAAGVLEHGPHNLNPFRLAFAAFGLIGLFGALIPLVAGLWLILPSHSEIEITESCLKSIERAGPFRWTFRRKIAALERFQVARRAFEADQRHPNPAVQAKWSAIKAQGQFKRPMIVAPGYPVELLTTLAHELSRRCATPTDTLGVLAAGQAPSHTAHAPAVEVEPAAAEGRGNQTPSEAEDYPKPASSKIAVLDDGTTLTIGIPPVGFRGTARFLTIFGLAWTAFTMVFIVAAVTSGIHGEDGRDASWWFVGPFLGVFLSVGLGILAGGIQWARRRAVLLLTADALTFSQVGPFRRSERSIPRLGIASVVVANSSVSVNGTPVKNLQVHYGQGKTLGLFTGRDEAELRWLAALLRRALGVSEEG